MTNTQVELLHLHEELRHRARQLSLLNDLAREMTGSLSTQAIYDLVTEQLWARFGYYSVETFTVDTQTQRVILASCAGAYRHLVKPGEYQQTFGQGLIGTAAATGRYVLANHARQHPAFYYLRGAEVQSELVIPIKSGEQIIGLLNVDSDKTNAFSQNDVLLLTTLSDQMAIALENARLFAQVQNHASHLEAEVAARTQELHQINTHLRQEIQAKEQTQLALQASQKELKAQAEALGLLNAISETLHRTLNFEAVVERAVNALVTYARFAAVGIFTLQPDEETIELVSARNFPPAISQVGRKLPIAGSLAGEALRLREIVTSEDMRYDARLSPALRQMAQQNNVQAAIAIPIFYQTEVLGTVHLLAPTLPNMTPLMLRMLTAIGRTVGLAMSNARYVNQIETEIQERKEIEAALRESEARFRQLADNAIDLIFRFRYEPPHYEYMNPTATRLTGYTPEDYYADPYLALKTIHAEDQSILTPFFRKEIHTNTPLLLRLVHRDGSVRWLEQRLVPVVDGNGVIVAVEGIGRDITEMKEALMALQATQSENA